VSESIRIPRRSFLAAVGLGAGGFSLGSFADASEATPAADGFRPNVFVFIAEATGIVSIVCARSEMGQGVRSTLPVVIADELGADMARVTIVQADGDEVYGNQNTDGSSSIRSGAYEKLRKLGAAARMMLIEAASKRWKVDPASCEARDHGVVHRPTKRSFSFQELALAASRLPVPADAAIVLRPRSELRFLGKDLPLLDGKDIVTGKAVFGADVRPRGMLTAVAARPPVVGGKAIRHDAQKALAVPGVKHVVPLPAAKPPFGFQPLGGIAVVGETTWAAMRGRAVLDVTWEAGPNGAYDSHRFREDLEASVRKSGRVVRAAGDADAALAKASRRIEAVYHAPHLAHAPMEPPVAVADVRAGSCEVWASTQDPQGVREELATALQLDAAKVTVHVTLLGGAFGRKSKPDYVLEAALVSKAVGAPVRMQWTREDDIQHDYYHTVSAQRLEAGLDSNGVVVAWHHRTAFPPISSTFQEATFAGDGELSQGVLDLPLAIPNVRAENCEARAHARIGWLRSVANIYHAFAAQSFVDEIAHLRGKDPRDNLLELIGPPRIVSTAELGVAKLPNYGQPLDRHPLDTGRHRRVIERVTELARWSERRAREGRALGLAVHRSFLTYVAVVVAVVRDRDRGGALRVDEAWIVADAGTIVNRDRVRAQLEGAVIFGLSQALYGGITMKDGRAEQSNFHDFRLMRIDQAPRAIHVDLIDSEGLPGGIGEPGVPPVAPALTNAIFALTGARIRALPVISARATKGGFR
jgi:isoquinoline 1-oxidoreductase beta subunit